jgi:diadenylate cyclase
LHDGAVVVCEGRIYAAGCILPLTQNDSIESELGTRHRAAIGMTEHSDAVVVVVSEETGSISIAKNGKLTRGVSRGDLRKILLEELVPQKDEDEKSSKGKKKKEPENGGEADEN